MRPAGRFGAKEIAGDDRTKPKSSFRSVRRLRPSPSDTLLQKVIFRVLTSRRGTRFDYTYYYPHPPSEGAKGVSLRSNNVRAHLSPDFPIHESISALDHQALDILTLPSSSASDAHDAFADYLSKTRNTICGRHPIGVLLGALSELERSSPDVAIRWVRYEQSSQCLDLADSSVSYASAFVVF